MIAPEIFTYRERPISRMLRRSAEIVLVLLGLAAAAPVIALAAVAILLEDGGPIFFRQRRVGRYERIFTIYKLRTMKRRMCGDALKPVARDDQRITKVGRILRLTSIDELPQLLNVLRGDMSLVGPRPEMPLVVHAYSKKWQQMRHLVPPGITCIWQTSCRSSISLERPEATLMDLQYIRQATPLFDLFILIKTIKAVLSTRGAH